MNKISEEQMELLQRFEERSEDPIMLIDYLLKFLAEKPEDEPLDPRWPDIWKKYRRNTFGSIPWPAQQPIHKKVEQIEKTLRVTAEEGIVVSESVGSTLTKEQNAFIKWLNERKKELSKFHVKEVRVGIPGIISFVFRKEEK